MRSRKPFSYFSRKFSTHDVTLLIVLPFSPTTTHYTHRKHFQMVQMRQFFFRRSCCEFPISLFHFFSFAIWMGDNLQCGGGYWKAIEILTKQLNIFLPYSCMFSFCFPFTFPQKKKYECVAREALKKGAQRDGLLTWLDFWVNIYCTKKGHRSSNVIQNSRDQNTRQAWSITWVDPQLFLMSRNLCFWLHSCKKYIIKTRFSFLPSHQKPFKSIEGHWMIWPIWHASSIFWTKGYDVGWESDFLQKFDVLEEIIYI